MSSSKRSPVLAFEAVVLLLLGIAALVAPFIAGLAVTYLIGWVLILSGAVGAAAAWAGRLHFHRGWSLASAIIAMVAGVLLLAFPLVGAITVAMVIGAYLVVDGVSLLGLALDRRKREAPGWPWLALSGVFDLALAIFILSLGAGGSSVLVGIIVGVDLIAAGLALLFQRQALAPAFL